MSSDKLSVSVCPNCWSANFDVKNKNNSIYHCNSCGNNFKKLHKMLKPNGSLIIAEISKQGMERVNMIRKKYGLLPLNKRWHNLHIDEKKIFPKF